MRARYYDCYTGRFISEDPAGFSASGSNLYIYANNNPVLLIDPSGLLIGPWPGYLTHGAAIRSGYNRMDSLKLAWNVMAEDRNSLDRNAPAANMHAMRGELSPNLYQSRGEAVAGTTQIIQNGSLASALHAGQDAPGHNFESMRDFGWNWPTVKHIARDIFPGPSTLNQAIGNTMNTLNRKP